MRVTDGASVLTTYGLDALRAVVPESARGAVYDVAARVCPSGVKLTEELTQEVSAPSDLPASERWPLTLEDYHRRLIPSHRVSPQQQTRAGTWCGYSVFFPLHPRVLEQYEDYPIYADTQLDEFFAEVFRQAAARRAARETEEGKGAPR